MLSKHIIGLIVVGLALSLTIGAIYYSNTSDAAFTDGDWTFTVTGGNATIISNTDTEVSILNIPSTVTAYDTTYPVTAIGDGTSSIVNNENLLANCVLIVPNTVTEIHNHAFESCTNISDATLSDSLTIIGNSAFKGCTNLALTDLPDSLTLIGGQAFYQCRSLALTSLPDGVTSIAGSAFQNCSNLALTSLPSGLTGITTSAFSNCTSLALTSLPSGVRGIGDMAFYNCPNLALTSLPDGVTTISNYTFYNCTNLALTSLPNGITRILSSAFENCTNLALTSLPDGLTFIGQGVFSGCTNLALTSLPSGLTTIRDSAFNGCTNLAITSIPEGVTSIGSSTFKDCTGITSLILPQNMETIGDNAFENCTNLKTIYNASDLTLTIGGTDNGRVSQYAENIYDDLHTLTILSNNTSYGTVSQSTAYAVDGGTISVSGDTITISEPAQTIKATPTSAIYKFTRWANTTGEITADKTIVAVFDPNEMTVSASPDTLYLVTGGPIPNTSSETVSLSYTGFGDGTYTWSIANDGGTGVNVTADGRIYGTAGDVTVSPATVTARLTGTVDGVTQTKDCTFQVIIVAKLIFTTNPINDGVIA